MRNTLRNLGLLVAAITIILAGATAHANKTADAFGIAMDAQNTLTLLEARPVLDRIPGPVLKQAVAVVILPSVVKAGFIIGGQGGKGVAFAGRKGEFGPPAFVSVAGGSIGLQIGAEKSTIILVLMTNQALDRLASGKVKLGTTLTVTAGPKGEMGPSKSTPDVYAYVQTKGLFAGATINGATVSFDDGLSAAFYGQKVGGARLLLGRAGSVTVPPAGESLRKELWQYARGK
jgi:SH3 domain-containing YSC84-like protein 1